jgi:hypothetical protein
MTTINAHLKKFRPKAHRTQKKNGQYLKMTIAKLSSLLVERNSRIKVLEKANKELNDLIEGNDLVEEKD